MKIMSQLLLLLLVGCGAQNQCGSKWKSKFSQSNNSTIDKTLTGKRDKIFPDILLIWPAGVPNVKRRNGGSDWKLCPSWNRRKFKSRTFRGWFNQVLSC